MFSTTINLPIKVHRGHGPSGFSMLGMPPFKRKEIEMVARLVENSPMFLFLHGYFNHHDIALDLLLADFFIPTKKSPEDPSEKWNWIMCQVYTNVAMYWSYICERSRPSKLTTTARYNVKEQRFVRLHGRDLHLDVLGFVSVGSSRKGRVILTEWECNVKVG